MSVKIKICDIRTAEIADFCSKQGVDFIGIHQIYYPITSDKLKTINEIKKVSGNMKLVLVTKENKIDYLIDMCMLFKWDFVQLHFETDSSFLLELKSRFNENGIETGIISVFQYDKFDYYTHKRIIDISDYVLFDTSMRGGTGNLSSDDLLEKTKIIKEDYFIAGGLTPENVADIIKKTRPFCVDVQSGVEYNNTNEKHKKSPQKIAAFIKAVKGIDI